MQIDAAPEQSSKVENNKYSKRRPVSAGKVTLAPTRQKSFIDFEYAQLSSIQEQRVQIRDRINSFKMIIKQCKRSSDIEGEQALAEAMQGLSKCRQQMAELEQREWKVVERYDNEQQRQAQLNKLNEDKGEPQAILHREEGQVKPLKSYDFLLELKNKHNLHFIYQEFQKKVADKQYLEQFESEFDHEQTQLYKALVQDIEIVRFKFKIQPQKIGSFDIKTEQTLPWSQTINSKLKEEGIRELEKSQVTLFKRLKSVSKELERENIYQFGRFPLNQQRELEYLFFKELCFETAKWCSEYQRLLRLPNENPVECFELKEQYRALQDHIEDFDDKGQDPVKLISVLQENYTLQPPPLSQQTKAIVSANANCKRLCTYLDLLQARHHRMELYHYHTLQILDHYQQTRDKYKDKKGRYFQKLVREAERGIQVCKRRLMAIASKHVQVKREIRMQQGAAAEAHEALLL